MQRKYVKRTHENPNTEMPTAGVVAVPVTDRRPLSRANDTSDRVQDRARRLNLILTGEAYDDLNALANERGTSMKEIVRLGVGLVKIAMQEARKGNRLVVTTPTGEALKELVIP